MDTIQNSFVQNNFSRSLYNEAKMGAYYTDVNHCMRIGRLFEWPEEEVCALEPSIGDGKAILACMAECKKKSVFGVELNQKTFQEIEGHFPYLINEDFLNGIKVSHKSFSFCFANPPYGEDQDKKERLEKLFIEKIYSYLKPRAYMALVIPHYVLTEEKVLRCFMARFEPVGVYRFDDNIYKQFKQVVVIAKRRSIIGCLKPWLRHFQEKVQHVEEIPYLPSLEEEIEDKYQVFPSLAENIEYFTTLVFDADKAGENLKYSPLYSVIGENAMPKEYSAAKLGRPPVPLKKDLLYICALSGGGQGIVGSAENSDLHLQRGVVKIEEEHEVREGDGVNKQEVLESSYSRISLNVIENDGTISTLE